MIILIACVIQKLGHRTSPSGEERVPEFTPEMLTEDGCVQLIAFLHLLVEMVC